MVSSASDILAQVQSGNGHILIVEDDPASQICLRMALEDAGFSVDAAPSIGGALELAKKRHPDILITDMVLPDGDGLKLYRDLFRTLPLPAIAVSGYDADFLKTDYLSCPEGLSCADSQICFSAYLPKPVDFDEITADDCEGFALGHRWWAPWMPVGAFVASIHDSILLRCAP